MQVPPSCLRFVIKYLFGGSHRYADKKVCRVLFDCSSPLYYTSFGNFCQQLPYIIKNGNCEDFFRTAKYAEWCIFFVDFCIYHSAYFVKVILQCAREIKKGGKDMNNLEHYRLRAGMTQKELADKSGISESSICRAEKGVTDLPGTRWKALAKALGCSLDELLGLNQGKNA